MTLLLSKDFSEEGLWRQKGTKESQKMEIENFGERHGGREPRAN
jgi:hypothetical protein